MVNPSCLLVLLYANAITDMLIHNYLSNLFLKSSFSSKGCSINMYLSCGTLLFESPFTKDAVYGFEYKIKLLTKKKRFTKSKNKEVMN